MRRGRSAVAWAAVAIAAAATGCGFGPGESSEGEATLTVTHEYGAEPVLSVSEQDPAASETVIRFLDRETEITTRYGGAFVQSIEGVSGEVSGGRSSDWFFYVNGLWSDRGAADVAVRGGDRIWWDYRDWTDATRVSAVVGSWPEPFLQASTREDERLDVEVGCMGTRPPCEEVATKLDEAGVEARVVRGPGNEDAARIQVGTVRDLASDSISHALALEPDFSGVFARLDRPSPNAPLFTLDAEAEPVRELAHDEGLIAALRLSDEPVTWLVTATGAAGVDRAAEALDPATLADHYAVAVGRDGAIPLPETEGG